MTINVVVNDLSVLESNARFTVANVRVLLSSPTNEPVRFQYETINKPVRFEDEIFDNTASSKNYPASKADYLAKRGVLTFRPNQTSANIRIVIKGDRVFESDENFLIKVTSSTVNPSIQRSSSGTVTILNDDPRPFRRLVTPNLPRGSAFRYAIVTSDVREAYRIGIDTYNQFVNRSAKSNDSLVRNIPGNWTAVGSYHGTNAVDNTRTNWETRNNWLGLPIYRIDGVKVADNYKDLWDGSIDAPINLTEKGTYLPDNVLVWTGSNSRGMGGDNVDIITGQPHWVGKEPQPGGGFADLLGAGLAMVGRTSATNHRWVNEMVAQAFPVIMENPLYAISPVQTV